MDLEFILMDDYDKKYKLSKNEMFCYSKSQLNDLFPNHDYYIIGEITGKGYSKEKGSANRLIYKGDEYALYDKDKKSKLIYRRVGYICVGEGRFVAVLQSRIPFLIILLLLLISIGIASSVLFSNMSAEPEVIKLNPLPEIDPYVSSIEDTTKPKDENVQPSSGTGGGSVSMVYTLEAKLSLSTGKIDMMFGNPKKSNHSVTVELYVDSPNHQIAIGESKLIEPGYNITNLDYIANSAVLKEGSYKGYYKVYYYDNNTGEKAIVASQIEDVDIIVSE